MLGHRAGLFIVNRRHHQQKRHTDGPQMPWLILLPSTYLPIYWGALLVHKMLTFRQEASKPFKVLFRQNVNGISHFSSCLWQNNPNTSKNRFRIILQITKMTSACKCSEQQQLKDKIYHISVSPNHCNFGIFLFNIYII